MAVRKVKKGDTYAKIARRHGVTEGAVARYFKGKSIYTGMKYNDKKLRGMVQGGQAYSIAQGMNPWGLEAGEVPASAVGTDFANSYLASLGMPPGVTATPEAPKPPTTPTVPISPYGQEVGGGAAPPPGPPGPPGQPDPFELEADFGPTANIITSPPQPPSQEPDLTGASIIGGPKQQNLWTGAPVSAALPLDDVYSILESPAFWNDPTLYESAMSGWISPENLMGMAPVVSGQPTGGRVFGGGYGNGGGPTPGSGWGGGAGAVEGGWATYTVEGAPDWWTGLTPTGGQLLAPTNAYAAVVNAMIPFSSPEDQRSMANNLARMLPDVFGSYSDVGLDDITIPTDITSGLRGEYTSAGRAEGMLTALDAMRAASTYEGAAFGPGYTYFENLANILSDFGGASASPQTRQQYTQLMAALDPIMAELQGQSLAAFGPAAQAVTQPFFSAGSLVPVQQLPNGEWIFGEPNVSLF